MRGGTVIQKAREEGKKRQTEGSRSFTPRFRINDGETAIVRFLEEGDDIVSAYVHHVPNPNPRSRNPIKIVCRDQDPETGATVGAECPGCNSTDKEIAKRRLQGAINLIWRDGPVYEKDNDGKIVTDARGNWVVADRADQVAVWTSGVRLFDELVGIDADYNGLASRDFKITRSGGGLDTEYTIRPAEIDGGPKPLSKADKALAEEKNDLTEFEAPRPVEDWWGNTRPASGADASPRPSFATSNIQPDASPFMNEE